MRATATRPEYSTWTEAADLAPVPCDGGSCGGWRSMVRYLARFFPNHAAHKPSLSVTCCIGGPLQSPVLGCDNCSPRSPAEGDLNLLLDEAGRYDTCALFLSAFGGRNVGVQSYCA